MAIGKKLISIWMALTMALFVCLPVTARAYAQDGSLAKGVSASDLMAQDDESADGDILLGVFTRSDDDLTNDIYASYDGETFYSLAEVYKDLQYIDGDGVRHVYQLDWHFPQTCPSIIYHDGYFWSLSNWNRDAKDRNGKFWPMISYSKDLVTWTHPEGNELLGRISTNTVGVPLNEYPTVNGSPWSDFDVVAPEWSITKSGEIYIVFTAGYYGEYHGEQRGQAHDQMEVYTAHVTKLSASDGNPDGGALGYLWPSNLVFEAEPAVKQNINTVGGSHDYIDGQLFTDNGTDYLVIKRDGLWNQLFQTNDITNPNGWEIVNHEVTYGYEGASIAKFNGKYRLYADGVYRTKPVGVGVIESSDLTTTPWKWDDNQSVDLKYPLFISHDGQPTRANGGTHANSARHGSVLTLTKGTDEWGIAHELLNDQIAKADGDAPANSDTMRRFYNPNSGEHFYTKESLESGNLSFVGWNYEGVGWFAPQSGGRDVYRLYSRTDHHYTPDASERDWLIGLGWIDEDVGWKSAEGDPTPSEAEEGKMERNPWTGAVSLYRQFNPNVDPQAPRNNSGSHNYTTSREENENLGKAGWKLEGIGWYGLASPSAPVESV